MDKSHFSLSWDKYHSSMCAGLSLLQQNGELVDLTVAAEGHLVKVHQIVLGVASPYMKELIQSADCKHPVIFMNNVSYKTLCSILEYVYMGEVSIEEENLEDFFMTARTLQIKGLEVASQRSDNSESQIKKMTESTPVVSSNVFKSFRIDILDNKHTKLTEEVQLPIHARNIQMKREFPAQPSLFPVLDAKKVKMSPKLTSTSEKLSSSQSDDATAADSEAQHDSDHDFGATHHDDQSDDEPDGTTEETKEDIKAKALKLDLKFTVSNKGGLQLILNRYMYSLRNYRKEHGSVRRWQCVDHRRKHCPAIAITDNDIVIKRKSLHNHPYHDKRIMVKIERKAVFSAIRTAENDLELIRANEQSFG